MKIILNHMNAMNNDLNALKNDKGPLMIEMYASWCPHCQRMMPVVEDLKALFAGKVNIYQFDIDENQELANELSVDGIPTFIVYKDGEEVWRGSGEMPGNVLAEKIQLAF
ncbi:MAG: thioredoxin family protein [Clostridium sp.]|nr:thioredoxin family protein [Prevotella sp.]MCM1429360.1 thioredoxin family protein [Clostridium sp.]MCM1475605.1 thioredoxin family protein [Muribaculaceae bacterium]